MERWQRILVEACKQAKNPFLPILQLPIEIQQLSSMELGVCFHGTLNQAESALNLPSEKLIASPLCEVGKFPAIGTSPQANENGGTIQATRTRLSVIIGSEGGFSPEEDKKLSTFSQAVRLPTHVLRVETAVVGLLTLLKWRTSLQPPLLRF
jgi:RsmE family RNA methyltransferase